MADLAGLDGLISKLRRSREFIARAAPAAAEAMAAELRATAAAGTSPDGTPWAPRKDGGRALANAAAAITVRAVGTVLLARAQHPYGIHNAGAGKTLPRRQVLPRGGIPPRVAEAIKRALVGSWEASS